ncbi:MAG: hypothetical protein IGS23_17535 [Rivularia sp. T60_A2020_040]|nr:hypothetical protein [Rivularia sp. T60_A2020_040]
MCEKLRIKNQKINQKKKDVDAFLKKGWGDGGMKRAFLPVSTAGSNLLLVIGDW